MKTRDILTARVQRVAEALGEDLPRTMFVGGVANAFYPTPQGLDVRLTDDVDCVIAIDGLNAATQVELEERLRRAGFHEDMNSPVTCRSRLTSSTSAAGDDAETILVDVMVIDRTHGAVKYGFTNRWYVEAAQNALPVPLAGGTSIRVISPLYFIATKLVAFADPTRGAFDSLNTDLEDIVATLTLNDSVCRSVQNDTSDVCLYVRRELVRIRERLIELIPTLVEGDEASQTRGQGLIDWMECLEL